MNIALTLHKVVKSEKYRLNHEDITVDKLAYLLRKIQNSTFAIEDLNKNNQNKSNFLLTFDDGFSSDFEIVLPMLKLMKINAVFFIVTSSIGKKGYLNEEQIVNLSKTGMTVGSHSVNHFDMTSLNKKNSMYELKNSKEKLESITGNRINAFSFPYGRHTKNLIEQVYDSGYKYCFTSVPGFFNNSDSLIPRISLNGRMSRKVISKTINKKFIGYYFDRLKYNTREALKQTLGMENYWRLRKIVLGEKNKI